MARFNRICSKMIPRKLIGLFDSMFSRKCFLGYIAKVGEEEKMSEPIKLIFQSLDWMEDQSQ
jgi:hypothetical protein